MNYDIEVTTFFTRQLKRLYKKYPSIKTEFAELVSILKDNPRQGQHIGNSCYKIRLAIASKPAGKSGGARVITHIQIIKRKVYMLSIYDKSEHVDVTESDIKNWIQKL